MSSAHLHVVNVEVAIVRAGRYLAIERGARMAYGAGWLTFPGGKLDVGAGLSDALEATARREAMEEVGLLLDDPVVYVESHTFHTPDIPVLDVVMLARAASGEATAASPDEVDAVHWLTVGEFLADPRTQPWTKTSLHLAESRRRVLGW
jgi:8-oxo-dGTP pyrophosphatase MutT (NUDIX family)